MNAMPAGEPDVPWIWSSSNNSQGRSTPDCVLNDTSYRNGGVQAETVGTVLHATSGLPRAADEFGSNWLGVLVVVAVPRVVVLTMATVTCCEVGAPVPARTPNVTRRIWSVPVTLSTRFRNKPLAVPPDGAVETNAVEDSTVVLKRA